MKKKPMITVLFMLFILFGFTTCQNANKIPQLGRDSVQQVVAAMSLEEKAELVVGLGMHFEVPDSSLSRIPAELRSMFNQPVEGGDSVYKTMVKQVSQLLLGAAGHTAAFERLGISTTILSDGPAGLRIQPKRPDDTASYYCTAFPIATLLASSWDTELIEKVGKTMGNEVLEYGADILLGPALNIQRNPLCGRNFEYYSEDPLIAGKMAAAMIKGVQSEGVGTSIKHFDANNQETHRNTVNTIVSQRALREIYLKGFRIAVQEGNPWTVMSSYNKINGKYASENPDLLTKVLRDDWGFKGYVMTDWFGGSDPVAQMKAGNDLLMPGKYRQINAIVDAVRSGKLDSALLDRNAIRILNIVTKSPRFKGYQYSNNPDLKEHAKTVRSAASEGIILLKNETGMLPLNERSCRLALFGNSSYETIIGGTGSGDVNEAYSVSLLNGLTDAGFKISSGLQDIYRKYIEETRKSLKPSKNFLANLMGAKMPVPEMDVTKNLAGDMARNSEIALITIGRNAGEGNDRDVEGDFTLTPTEQLLLKNVTAAYHKEGKKVLVVLNIDGVIEVASWRDLPDAILLAWQPGQEAGHSIADVISGKVNPSGRLTVTFPVNYEDEPSAPYFPGVELEVPGGNTGQKNEASFMRKIPAEVIYGEDIYVGYRYFNTFKVPVAYEFGYGLSYTKFEYSNFTLGSDTFNEHLMVSVDVKNTGAVAGREVVQLYLHAPEVNFRKPAEELKAFDKTRLLAPGEKQTLQFKLNPDDLASFDETRSSWVADPGKYQVRIGASSIDIRESGTFNLVKEMVVNQVSNALAPNREINHLEPK